MDDSIRQLLAEPPREYSLLPFWFWNDELDAGELVRQIADFEAHGVYGLVIHPRVGLPRSIGWMSDRLLDFMRIAIDEARRRDMKVVLYDEGMYPSGSSSGQVVADDPTLACRCLALHKDGDTLPADANVVSRFERGGTRYVIVDRKSGSVIRGLHYLDESVAHTPGIDPPEDEPPAGDILNPRTVESVITKVHQRFAEHFGGDFGTTIVGVFTDEPNALGRTRDKGILPYTTGLLPELQRLSGRDFSAALPALFFDDEPDAAAIREAYSRAIRARLEETWYAPLSAWCERHGLWLMGHPDAGDEIGVQRHLHCPGQDVVWRWVEPGNLNAIEGPESTQGKCTSSAMLHHGRARNSNEFAGAFGHQTTFEEVRWIARWLLVRGVNLLIPHAFFYSIRGPRKDERPPQLGPHTPAWSDGRFKRFADECRRWSWMNASSQHVCSVAILTHEDRCPWPAAKACLERQVDFNYLEPRDVLADGTATGAESIAVASMRYCALIVDGDRPLSNELSAKLRLPIHAGRVLRFGSGDDLSATEDADELIRRVRNLAPATITFSSIELGLRVRQVRQGRDHFFFFFNEREAAIETNARLTIHGEARWVDLATGHIGESVQHLRLHLPKWAASLLWVRENS